MAVEPGPFVLNSSDNGYSAKIGYRISATTDFNLISITKNSNTSGITLAYVLNSSKGVIASASFSGNVATFSGDGVALSSGTTYYLAVDNGGSSFNSYRRLGVSYPVSGTVVNWTGGLHQAGGVSVDDSTLGQAIDQFTYELDGAVTAESRVTWY